MLDISRISFHLKGCRGGVCFHYSVACITTPYICVCVCVSNPKEERESGCVQQCVCVNECVCVIRKWCQPWGGHIGPGAHSLWPPLPLPLCHIDSISITTVKGTIKNCCVDVWSSSTAEASTAQDRLDKACETWRALCVCVCIHWVWIDIVSCVCVCVCVHIFTLWKRVRPREVDNY